MTVVIKVFLRVVYAFNVISSSTEMIKEAVSSGEGKCPWSSLSSVPGP